mmetsp:Transcript_15148/g.43257  ORF Transcript_15148/g.43257 Transcript_15148/m.43257 type:complete len:219 (+) Transcript_15148:348-1004(+)
MTLPLCSSGSSRAAAALASQSPWLYRTRSPRSSPPSWWRLAWACCTPGPCSWSRSRCRRCRRSSRACRRRASGARRRRPSLTGRCWRASGATARRGARATGSAARRRSGHGASTSSWGARRTRPCSSPRAGGSRASSLTPTASAWAPSGSGPARAARRCPTLWSWGAWSGGTRTRPLPPRLTRPRLRAARPRDGPPAAAGAESATRGRFRADLRRRRR